MRFVTGNTPALLWAMDSLMDDKPGITGLHTPSWQHVMADQD